MMKAVILAAGKGSRLYPVTHFVPKPLLPVAGKPILVHAFSQLEAMNIKEVCVVRGKDHEEMESYLRAANLTGLKIHFAIQAEQKGLAHALQSAREFIKEDPFVLYLGDAIYETTLEKVAKEFLESKCDNLNLVKPVLDPERYGVAILEKGRIIELEEKPVSPKSNLAMAGIYWFTSKIWKVLEELKPGKRGEHEITDAIKCLIDQGDNVRGCVYQNKWFDTGTLSSFLEANRYLSKGKNFISSDFQGDIEVGENVFIGSNVKLECKRISDSVILDGSSIKVNGTIEKSLLGGAIFSEDSLDSELLFHFSSMTVPVPQ